MSDHVNHAHGSDSHNPHPAKALRWKSFHRDWRIWAGAILAIGCMIYYVLTMDFAWRPRSQQTSPTAIRK